MKSFTTINLLTYSLTHSLTHSLVYAHTLPFNTNNTAYANTQTNTRGLILASAQRVRRTRPRILTWRGWRSSHASADGLRAAGLYKIGRERRVSSFRR